MNTHVRRQYRSHTVDETDYPPWRWEQQQTNVDDQKRKKKLVHNETRKSKKDLILDQYHYRHMGGNFGQDTLVVSPHIQRLNRREDIGTGRRQRHPVGSTDHRCVLDSITKKNARTRRTKKTERRVQRRVVLEDGRILQRDEPEIVKTHEVEDIYSEDDNDDDGGGLREIDEYNNSHKHTRGRSRHQNSGYRYRNGNSVSGTVEQLNQNVNTNDVRECLTTTRVSRDIGLVSKRGIKAVLNKKCDINDVLHSTEKLNRGKQESTTRKKRGKTSSPSRRHRSVVVHRRMSHKKTVDTEKVHSTTKKNPVTGKVETVTKRDETHEVYQKNESPVSDGRSASRSTLSSYNRDEETFRSKKQEEFVDHYYKTRCSSNPASTCSGEVLTRKKVQPQKEIDKNNYKYKWDAVEAEMKKKLGERNDALTKKPLNLHREERTRIKETDKWLDQHFGSDWSLNSSLSSPYDKNKVRRTLSFSTIPQTKTQTELPHTTTMTTHNPSKRKLWFTSSNLESSRHRNPNQRYYNSTLSLITGKHKNLTKVAGSTSSLGQLSSASANAMAYHFDDDERNRSTGSTLSTLVPTHPLPLHPKFVREHRDTIMPPGVGRDNGRQQASLLYRTNSKREKPLYKTELHHNHLYPMFDLNETTDAQSIEDNAEYHDTLFYPTNYRGYKNLERTDGVANYSTPPNIDEEELTNSTKNLSLEAVENVPWKKTNRRRFSAQFEDDYGYPLGALKDTGRRPSFSRPITPPPQFYQQKRKTFDDLDIKNYSAGRSDDNSSTPTSSDPLTYKTVIFLSG